MKPKQKGGTHVPITTLRNGCGESRDSARRSIIFMAVHRRTAFFARLFTGVSAIHRGRKLKIVHTQECPDYRKEYLLLSDVPITAKIYVINDETHATMLFCEEY